MGQTSAAGLTGGGERLSGRERAPRLLEASLVATFVMHGLAMVAMALVLAPMLPGGGPLSDLDRVRLIADHPLRYRLGWLPWHLTAASDLVLAFALLRTPFVPRAPAYLQAALTLLAVVLDQGGQFLLVTRGVELAHHAAAGGGRALSAFLQNEAFAMPITSAWAALVYTLGSVAWTWCFWSAGVWSKGLSRLSLPLWAAFVLIATGPLWPEAVRPSPQLVAAGNALGFIGLEAWFWMVGEALLRRSRPEAPHGRWAPWRYPEATVFGGALGLAANSRFARALCERLPVLEFRSDITDVVYVNYLAPAERLAPFVPEGLELQRLGPGGRWAMFSMLTYRHGGFAPSLLGPLRRLFGSPIQSNWRTYVRDPRTGKEGIYFTTSSVTTRLHALGARLMTEGVSMHMPERASLDRSADGSIALALSPGKGSAPDLEASLSPAAPLPLEPPWSECFDSYRDMLAYAVPQDRAMSTQPWKGMTTRQEIVLGIPLEACEPLSGEVRSRAAEAIVGEGARPICFRVPAVSFVMTAEQHDRW